MIRNCELYNSSQTKHKVTTKNHQSISSMSFGNLKELTEVQQENQVVNVNQKKGTTDNFKAKMLQVKTKSSQRQSISTAQATASNNLNETLDLSQEQSFIVDGI